MTTQDQLLGEDDRLRAALARLTRNERECLRRRLHPQTAKEMAIDLGISPHAVEKRLKMARAKLGVTSSLAAARLLEAQEYRQAPERKKAHEYQKTAVQPADLPGGGVMAQDAAAPDAPRRRKPPPAVLALGVISMMFVATLLALASQAHRAPPAPAGEDRTDDVVLILPARSPGPRIEGSPAPENAADIPMRPAGPDEVAAFARSSFATMDKDGSGFVEAHEAPVAGVGDTDGSPGAGRAARRPTTRWAIGPKAKARWIALMDRDGDGRVSEAEYVVFESRVWRDHVPANWAWRR